MPPRLYGLAKVHKKNNPLRPVLSLPDSSYYKLNKVLAKLFEKIEGATVETKSLDEREILESINLEPNENLISSIVKSLYSKVPLKQAIDTALRELYVEDETPSIARKTMKRLLNMLVSQVHFKSNESWYVRKDGLAMGASLAVVFANLWLKQYVIPVQTGSQVHFKCKEPWYVRKDGLAMGASLAVVFANLWLNAV